MGTYKHIFFLWKGTSSHFLSREIFLGLFVVWWELIGKSCFPLAIFFSIFIYAHSLHHPPTLFILEYKIEIRAVVLLTRDGNKKKVNNRGKFLFLADGTIKKYFCCFVFVFVKNYLFFNFYFLSHLSSSCSNRKLERLRLSSLNAARLHLGLLRRRLMLEEAFLRNNFSSSSPSLGSCVPAELSLFPLDSISAPIFLEKFYISPQKKIIFLVRF